MFDRIIANGTIVDGSRQPRFVADVGIAGDRVVAIDRLRPELAREVLDARGLVVAPGFVDVHNHSDGWMLRVGHLTAKTMQGFTTEILMSDGISYAPVNADTAPQWIFYLRALNGLRLGDYQGWRTLEDYLRQLDRRNVQNALLQIPYANVRALSCGFGRSAVDDSQMLQIQGEVRRGMHAGAAGLSTGLDYIVQCFATTDELVEACGAMRETRGIYVTHMRYKKRLMAGLREAVEIGRRAQVPVHISHLKALAPHTADEVLQFIDQVARREVDFSFDVYPYQPGSTMLSYLLPYEVWEGGPLAVLDRLRSPVIRERVRVALSNYRLDFDHIRIAWLPSRDNAQLLGLTLAEFIAQSGRQAEDAICDLLMEERLAVLCVYDEGDDRLVWPMLQHDLFMVGSDGIWFPDGQVHPRVYGTGGRILGPLVREAGLFSLEDAVYKLAAWPARRFGLRDRGVLRAGAFADLVVFDPDEVSDRATFAEPHQTCAGIQHVFVNGTPVVVAGQPREEFSEPLPGRALRYEPS